MFLHKLESGSTFVVLQDYHAILAGEFAVAWGNESFDAADPGAKYMARNHDAGWLEHDQQPGTDPSTGLPWHIADMHPNDLNPIHRKSIARNSSYSHYTGILSCMHTMGFYNSRMGQSDFAVMDDYPDKHPELIHPMVEDCTSRIESWKSELVEEGESPESLESRIWRSYRLLEAFDTMSIYFCIQPMSDLKPQTFPNIPARGDELTSVTFTPMSDGQILVDPYPFAVNPLTVYLHGRVIDNAIQPSSEVELTEAPAVDVAYSLVSSA